MSTHAFIVGLENYQAQAKRIPPVAYAELDARAVAKAFKELGVPVANITTLLSAQATKASFESRFKTTISSLTTADTFIFFFAGHGLSINDQNFLTCHDTQRGDLTATSTRLDWIFNTVRQTKCRQAMFFLDCCHSGLPIEGAMRGIADHVSDSEFETLFGNSEYHIAFAACKTDELSHSAETLSHGIWTHHLLRALSGEDPDAFDRGRFVTSRSLQNYLAAEVPRTLRRTIAGAARQTPCMFGNATAEFIVADLKSILDARQAALTATATTPRDAAFVGTQFDRIRSLSGFKRFHTVPKHVSTATQQFVASIGEEEVREHANRVLSSLRSGLHYGIRDVDRSIEGDSATLKTKDFDVNIYLFQDQDEPDTYVIRTEITNFRNPSVVTTDEFNKAVSGFVETLELNLPSKFNVEDLIVRLEKSSMKDSVSIDYDADLIKVEVHFDDTGVLLRFRDGRCEVIADRNATPLGLLEAVSETQVALLTHASAKVPLLNP